MRESRQLKSSSLYRQNPFAFISDLRGNDVSESDKPTKEWTERRTVWKGVRLLVVERDKYWLAVYSTPIDNFRYFLSEFTLSV